MEHTQILTEAQIFSIVSGIIIFMLGIIGWFLIRFVRQYDEANKDHVTMFDKLIKRFDTLTAIIYEHKTDVEVIKTQLNSYNKDLQSVDTLYERVRVVENDVAFLKASK
jgi:GTP:adenosylcobinamide-phosphate guanylyltransferase